MDRDQVLKVVVREVMVNVKNKKAHDKLIKLIMTVYDQIEEEADAKTGNSKLLHSGPS